jgi:hypothetical protein
MNPSRNLFYIVQGAIMMAFKQRNRIGASAVMILMLSPFAVNADTPGRHPAYLHALSDLRTARWLLEHQPGDKRVGAHEGEAVTAIDAAIGEIKRAAIDDGKDIHDHSPVDAPDQYGDRLHRAVEVLHRTRDDVAHEEDDPALHGLRNRAVGHIDEAIRQTGRAIYDMEHHR